MKPATSSLWKRNSGHVEFVDKVSVLYFSAAKSKTDVLENSYLRTHSKNCLSYFIEFDYFHIHVDSRCIWLNVIFTFFIGSAIFLWSHVIKYILELVFDELFCSNVDNNCVLTFDWFLSESTIWLDANKGTNFSVGGQLLDA